MKTYKKTKILFVLFILFSWAGAHSGEAITDYLDGTVWKKQYGIGQNTKNFPYKGFHNDHIYESRDGNHWDPCLIDAMYHEFENTYFLYDKHITGDLFGPYRTLEYGEFEISDSNSILTSFLLNGIYLSLDTYTLLNDNWIPPGNLNLVSYFKSPGNEPADLTFDGKYLWCIDTRDDKIYKFNFFGKIISTIDPPGPHLSGITFVGEYLWVGTKNKIYRLDSTGKIIDSFPSSSASAALAFDGKYIWEATANRWIAKRDTSGNIIDRISIPYSNDTPPPSIAFDGMYLWWYHSSNFKIHRMDTTGKTIGTFDPFTLSVDGLVSNGAYLWISTGTKRMIYKVKIPSHTTTTILVDDP